MAYELTDEEWSKLKELLPKKKMRRPCLDSEFGKWNSVYRYFCRLLQKGVFEKIFAELTKDKISEELSLDSTFVKVHRHGLGAKKGLNDS